MSIGLGVFLAALYVGTVYLYVHTRDRWHWSKIVGRGCALVSLAVLAVGVGFVGLAQYERWQERPRLITTLGGVTIGEAWADVAFRLGEFKPAKILSPTKYPDEVRHEHPTLPLAVTTRQDRVYYVVHHCRAGAHIPVNGIKCGDDGSALFAKFGSSIRILCSKSPSTVGNFRVYDAIEYGTRYVLNTNKVVAIAVAAPDELASFVGLSWEICGLAPLEITPPEEAKAREQPRGVKVTTD